MKNFFLLLASVITSSVAYSQDFVPKDSIILKLRKVRNEVLSVKTQSAQVKTLISNCGLLINDALIRLNNFNGTYPSSYDIAMTHLVGFAKQITAQDTAVQKQSISVLCSDIRSKFVELPNQFSGTLYNDMVTVKVITLKQGNEIKNLRVRYAFLGYKVDHNTSESFQQLSSPVSEKMVPGWYEVWITNDGDFKVLQSWTGEINPSKENIIQLNIQ